MALALKQTADGSLDLSGGGPRLVSGAEALQAAMFNRLSTQAGEWVYDKTYGVPWREVVLRRYFSAGETAGILAATASLATNAARVSATQVDLTTNSVTRRVEIRVRGVRVRGSDLENEGFDLVVPSSLG